MASISGLFCAAVDCSRSPITSRGERLGFLPFSERKMQAKPLIFFRHGRGVNRVYDNDGRDGICTRFKTFANCMLLPISVRYVG